MIYFIKVAAPSLSFLVIKMILTFLLKLHFKLVRPFYISFVQSSGQWQQCIWQRHTGTVNWIAIVLWHKTNGSLGISVVVILVMDTIVKVCD